MKFYKETQTFLNTVFKENLVTDGIEGRLTIEAKQRAINKLFFICDAKKWDRLEFIKGLTAIRVGDTYTNEFTDWAICFNNTGTDFYAIPCSTKPGTVAVIKKGVENIMGKVGVAVLTEGQHKRIWSRQGAWWSGLPFYYQIAPVKIFRDNIVDTKIDRHQIQEGMFGINAHSWKNGSWLWNITTVSYWTNLPRKIGVSLSEGCIVAQAMYWIPYEQDTTKKNTDGIISCTIINTLYDF
jgi:hypothetical protein